MSKSEVVSPPFVHLTCSVPSYLQKGAGGDTDGGRGGDNYNTIQLYCLYVEKFAFWLVIYIKTFNTVNSKTSTTQ